jgi:tetratricopeptide (TPR) repeat protein
MVMRGTQIGVVVAMLVCGVGAGSRSTSLSITATARQEPRPPSPPSEDFVAGYQAYAAGDYDAALRYYEAALSQTTDPGMVAYHQGVVLAAAGRHGEAAAAWGRTLEDAQGARRIKAAYGQATALTHSAAGMAGRRAVRVLQQALQLFDIVGREAAGVEGLGSVPEDAKYNRAVAEALLAKKLKEPEPPDPPEEEVTQDQSDSMIDREAQGQGDRPNQPGGGRAGAAGNRRGAPQGGGNDNQPGAGNLPPQLDEDRTPPIPPEEAQRLLDEVLRRLRRPLANTPSRPGAKDW